VIRPAKIAASVLLGLTMLVTAAQPAAALAATQTFQNAYTDECIDDSRDFHLRTFPCNHLNYQAWIVTRSPNGTFELRNSNTQLCIDDSIEFRLRTFPCNGLAYQRWTWFTDGDTTRHWWQNSQTGRCMNADRGHVLFAAICHNSGDQFWF
jgi:hypothetical protein